MNTFISLTPYLFCFPCYFICAIRILLLLVLFFLVCWKNTDPCISSSNVLFREFALISMWRVPKMPIGAHMLLSFLAEPLKQPTDALLSNDDHDFSENMHEFEDWVCFSL